MKKIDYVDFGVRLRKLRRQQGFTQDELTQAVGISTSFLLIRLGWYQAYLIALHTVALDQLWLMAVGFAISALASMKAVQWLFAHARAAAYGMVLGFLLVSVALVFPGWDSGSLFWADCALLAAGAVIAGEIHPSK